MLTTPIFVSGSYPLPPTGMVMPADVQLYRTMALAFLVTICWACALRITAKTRDVVPVLVMLGGSLTVLAEAPIDVLGLCHWADINQWPLYETFGQKIPVITLFAYTAFFGGVVLFILQQFRTGTTYWSIWKWFWIWATIEAVMEPIPINLGVWRYYGAQPFVVFDFPLWWPPVNTVGAYTAAFLVYKILPLLNGAGKLLIVPIAVLSGDFMGNAAVAWPIWSALNSTAGYVATIPAGILTLVLCGFAMHFIAMQAEQKIAP
ncbi:MAG: hypothetical protein PHQ05_09735 [Sterolibacterium sp.]|nr:hypothetical protein [Sterolibacterium sp.]